MTGRADKPRAAIAPRRSAPSGRTGGFTLVEALIVIAIITVLMAIVIPSYNIMSAQNQRASCAANLKSIGQALALFREDYQCYPPDSTEFLWTEEAVEQYRIRYGVTPPGDHSVGTLVGAAYHPDGAPFNTGVRGLGLFTLYYLGAYAAQPPPLSSEPRVRDYEESTDPLLRTLRSSLERTGRGLNALPSFRGSGYVTELNTFHCPASAAVLPEDSLPIRGELPMLRGWNTYDAFYRRNFWHPGRPDDLTDNRNLFRPYPPADTVVTWCPHHRKSQTPWGPGAETEVVPGDEDLVLFADGSVRRMVSQRMNRMYQEPSPGAPWPEGPIL